MVRRGVRSGLEQEYAEWLADLDIEVAGGIEERFFRRKGPHRVLGKRTLAKFFEENKSLWI